MNARELVKPKEGTVEYRLRQFAILCNKESPRSVEITSALADPATCSLYATETVETSTEAANGETLKLRGKPVTARPAHP